MINMKLIKIIVLFWLVIGSYVIAMESNSPKKPSLSAKDYANTVELLNKHSLTTEQKTDLFCSLGQKKACKRKLDYDKENQIPSQAVGKKLRVVGAQISPLKKGEVGNRNIRKQAIYAWIAYKNHDKSHIPIHEERIDFSSIMGEGVEINDENLNEALLKVENQVQAWIEKHPVLYSRVAYIGQAENMTHRFKGHRNDVNSLVDVSERFGTNMSRWNASKKLQFFGELGAMGYDVVMSGLVYKIPDEYLSTLEVLLGGIFRALYKGGTVLGNKEAWANVQKYEAFKLKQGLSGSKTVENLDNQFIKCLLDIGQQ